MVEVSVPLVIQWENFLSHCWDWRLFTVPLYSKQCRLSKVTALFSVLRISQHYFVSTLLELQQLHLPHYNILSHFLWSENELFSFLWKSFRNHQLPVMNPKVCRVRIHTIKTHTSIYPVQVIPNSDAAPSSGDLFSEFSSISTSTEHLLMEESYHPRPTGFIFITTYVEPQIWQVSLFRENRDGTRP